MRWSNSIRPTKDAVFARAKNYARRSGQTTRRRACAAIDAHRSAELFTGLHDSARHERRVGQETRTTATDSFTDFDAKTAWHGKNRSTAICIAIERGIANAETKTCRRTKHFRRCGPCPRGSGIVRNGRARISESAHDTHRRARSRAHEFSQTLFRFVSETHRKDAVVVGVSCIVKRINRPTNPKYLRCVGASNDSTRASFTRKSIISRPDAIVCTHFLPPELLSRRIERGHATPPVWVQVTDFDVHGLWVHEHMTGYCVANEEIAWRIAERGIPTAKVHVTGIPIAPQFCRRSIARRVRKISGSIRTSRHC